MGRIEKSVFLSYRRASVGWATAIYQNLTHNGYDVFMDFLGLTSGDFARAILDNIEARAHFIVLLTPSALERCVDADDWLRREIEHALRTKRNIVPALLEGADFRVPALAEQLKGSLASLQDYNALDVPPNYFDAAMTRLRERYLNVSLDAVVHPISSEAKQLAQAQQDAARTAQPVESDELAAEAWLDRRPREIITELPRIARPSASWGARAETEVLYWLLRKGPTTVNENGYFVLHQPSGSSVFAEIRLVGPDPHLAKRKVQPSIEGALARGALPLILFLVAANSTIGQNALPVLGPYLRDAANVPQAARVILSHLDDADGLRVLEAFGNENVVRA